jgi:Ca2+-binding EF-hand superfamily protein
MKKVIDRIFHVFDPENSGMIKVSTIKQFVDEVGFGNKSELTKKLQKIASNND